MMKTRNIYMMLASLMMLLGMSACSNNVDGELVPTIGERTLTVDGHDAAFTMNFNAGPSSEEVSVESNTLWKVEVESEGGWCTVDKANGRGKESFSISVRDNMIKQRVSTVTVYTVDAQGEILPQQKGGKSITITVSQDVSDVRLEPSSLTPFAPSGEDNKRQLFTIVANAAWTLGVTYEESNAIPFVTITPESGDMQEAADGTFSGRDGASFYMSLSDNRTGVDRKAYLNLRSEVGSYTVEITQIRSEYSFDVTPSEPQMVAAKGDDIEFEVLSIVGWSVNSSADWISFSVPSYSEGSDKRVPTIATIAPNTSGSERSAEIRFTPSNPSYQGLSVTLTQRAYDMTFAISSAGGAAVVMEKGGSLSFDLDSRFDWTLETPTWVTADLYSGSKSTSSREITLIVAENTTNNNREGTVTVYPQPTGVDGGATLDPIKLGIEPLRFSVTQFGGKKPAVSMPWVVDGYTQTSATVVFNYYSPFAAIVEAGLFWKREDASEWNYVPVSVSDPTDGVVSVDLTSLEPATKYVARGYVKDANGGDKEGPVSYTFSTTGQYPSSGDNPTPSR